MPHAHRLQFYTFDEDTLVKNLTDYVREGLERESGVMVVAGAEHRRAVVEGLRRAGVAAAEFERSGRLQLLDVDRTLDMIYVDGRIDAERFDAAVGGRIARLSRDYPKSPPRAYGEIVDVLWRRGDFAEAVHLERLWNELLETQEFELFCGYGIDVCGDEFQFAAVDALLCSHTRLMPAADAEHLQGALQRALDDVFGERADSLRSLMRHNFRPSWPALPKPEANILWLRNNLPDYTPEVLSRARTYYKAS